VESGGCHEVVRLRGECSESDAVDAEHEWLSQRCPGWEPLSHALTSSVRGQPNKVEDHLRIRTAEGKELAAQNPAPGQLVTVNDTLPDPPVGDGRYYLVASKSGADRRLGRQYVNGAFSARQPAWLPVCR